VGVLPEALAFSNDADATRERSVPAVTTIPFAGKRDPHWAPASAAREVRPLQCMTPQRTRRGKSSAMRRLNACSGPKRPAKTPEPQELFV
jgi:hypothetical protein